MTKSGHTSHPAAHRSPLRCALLGPYRRAAVATAAAVALFFQWFIVVSGATVRLTGSGLGCPNWPTCTTDSALPALDQHALIEFINRVNATPTLLTALVAAWMCWRIRGARRRDLRIASVLTVLGVLVQAVLGAFTVVLELPPTVVSVHFLVSVAILANATFLWHAARQEQPLVLRARGPRGGAAADLARPAATAAAGLVMLLSLLAVIVAGVVTTASGPHSGGGGTGHLVERIDAFDLAVTLHARGAYVFLALVVALSWWRRRAGGPALANLTLVLVLVVLQVALGELQYRSGLPWQVVLAHVANAGLLWIAATNVAVGAVASRA